MEKLGFHESTVTDLQLLGDTFFIELEDVSSSSGRVKVKVEVDLVTNVYIDSNPVGTVTMPFGDGEVLSLIIIDTKLDLLIEWNKFPEGESVTHSYTVSGEKIRLSVN